MAQSLYVKKRDHFRGLSETHAHAIPEWYQRDRSPVILADGKVESVYSHTATKRKPTFVRGDLDADSMYDQLSLLSLFIGQSST
jgi:hypothetical protein